MKCPNCERSTDIFGMRCRVCRQRLPFWYIFIIVLMFAALVGLMLLLDHY